MTQCGGHLVESRLPTRSFSYLAIAIKMGYLSDHAANACMYTSYAAVLIMGLAAAWYSRKRGQFLSANGTRTAIPLTFNFVASGKFKSSFYTNVKLQRCYGCSVPYGNELRITV